MDTTTCTKVNEVCTLLILKCVTNPITMQVAFMPLQTMVTYWICIGHIIEGGVDPLTQSMALTAI